MNESNDVVHLSHEQSRLLDQITMINKKVIDDQFNSYCSGSYSRRIKETACNLPKIWQTGIVWVNPKVIKDTKTDLLRKNIETLYNQNWTSEMEKAKNTAELLKNFIIERDDDGKGFREHLIAKLSSLVGASRVLELELTSLRVAPLQTGQQR